MRTTDESAGTALRKLVLACAVAAFSASALAACNTMEGAGEDVESAGESIQRGAD